MHIPSSSVRGSATERGSGTLRPSGDPRRAGADASAPAQRLRAPTRAVSRGLTKSYNNKKFYQEIASAPVHTLTLDGPLSCIEAGETLSR